MTTTPGLPIGSLFHQRCNSPALDVGVETATGKSPHEARWRWWRHRLVSTRRRRARDNAETTASGAVAFGSAVGLNVDIVMVSPLNLKFLQDRPAAVRVIQFP
jgi:hypothetical protein